MSATETIRRFKTKRFTVTVEATPEYADLDLSWDDTGEVREQIKSGALIPFNVDVYVCCDGRLVGEDHLGQCIYADMREFMDHVGLAEKSRADGTRYGSYFTDMVRNAIHEARKNLQNVPRVRIVT